MSPNPPDREPAPYDERGFLLLHHLVPPDLCDFFTHYLATLSSVGRLVVERQMAQAQGVHGDAAFDTLLDMARPTVAGLIGRPLLPTYSYARLYRTGSELERHTDRGACEHSLTVHLGSDEDEEWPLWLRDGRGDDVAVTLRPGDALCYRGRDLEHWRTPFTGRYHAQVFLHYVDADGPDADLAFDGRPGLGLSRPPTPSA